MDTVRVSVDNYKQVTFLAAVERRKYTKQPMPGAQRPQRTSKAGVPLWSVKVAVIDWRDVVSELWITVPSMSNPSITFAIGDRVTFDDLVFGIAAKADRSGYSTWRSASAVTLARPGAVNHGAERQHADSLLDTWSATWWSM